MSDTPFNVICYPIWEGSDKRGSELSPAILSDVIVSSSDNCMECAALSIPQEAECAEEKVYNAKHLQRIIDANIALRDVVYGVLCSNHIPIVLGGDHSLGLGSVSASAKRDPNIGVIWFDAHGDMNTEETSPTGHIHGMPVAALMGLCKSRLNDIPTNYVKPQNIFWIGARSLDEGEKKLIERLHLNVYSTDEIHHRGMYGIMAEVADKMQRLGIKNVHCSFDVDAMDPTIVAATGCLVPNGLNNQDLEEFTSSLSCMGQHITALDFVEYNPLLDDAQYTSLQWCQEALQQLCNAISRNRA